MGGMRMSSATEETEYKESANFGMMTKYLRTVNFADWPEDAEDPPLMVAKFLDGLFPHNLPSFCNTDVYVVPTSHDKTDLLHGFQKFALMSCVAASRVSWRRGWHLLIQTIAGSLR